MSEETVVFVDGHFVPKRDARVSAFDRGFLFADGVYEVAAVLDGHLVDLEAHLARLERSCHEIKLKLPQPRHELASILRELVRRNATREGMVYLQITRGAAEVREFGFPGVTVEPTVVAFTQSFALVDSQKGTKGAPVITVPELRWKRRDIKSVALLAQVLARQAAVEAGAAEAWFVEDGFVTEGAASNAYIVVGGTLVTRPLSYEILHGTTRARVLEIARDFGIPVEERRFTVGETKAADEAFSTGAAALVVPAISIDGETVGDGKPGKLTMKLRAEYIKRARRL